MRCPKCMVDYTRPLNFCPADGTPLNADALRLAVRGHVVQPSRRVDDAVQCGGCRAMLALHVRFCPDCGTEIATIAGARAVSSTGSGGGLLLGMMGAGVVVLATVILAPVVAIAGAVVVFVGWVILRDASR